VSDADGLEGVGASRVLQAAVDAAGGGRPEPMPEFGIGYGITPAGRAALEVADVYLNRARSLLDALENAGATLPEIEAWAAHAAALATVARGLMARAALPDA
jgi:hypothetical protein